MKYMRMMALLSLLVVNMQAVDYLSAQYTKMLTQRYPEFETQINSLVSDLNVAWTQYKSVEDQVTHFQGTTAKEAHDLNELVRASQNTIKTKSAELSDLLCLAQKNELKNQIIESDWVLIP